MLVEPVDDVEQALLAVDRVMQSCIALAGFAMDDMTRDEGWSFLIVGRRLERLAIQATLIAGVMREEPRVRGRSLEWLLETGNSIITYRARYRRAPELLPVLHLLAFDVSNPHSVAFPARQPAPLPAAQCARTRAVTADAARSPGGHDARLRPHPLRGRQLQRACEELANLLFECEAAAYQVSDELQRQYFAHTGRTARMGLAVSELRYHIRHDTRYEYDQPVGESRQMLRLTPRDLPWQRCLSHRLVVEPQPTRSNDFVDDFGNRVRTLHLQSDHDALIIRAESWVALEPQLARARRLAQLGGGFEVRLPTRPAGTSPTCWTPTVSCSNHAMCGSSASLPTTPTNAFPKAYRYSSAQSI